MATRVIYTNVEDGYIRSATNTTYSTARAMTTPTAVTSAANITVGQQFSTPNYQCFEGFVRFDTNGTASPSSAVLALFQNSDSSTTDFVCEARAHTWGPTLASGAAR